MGGEASPRQSEEYRAHLPPAPPPVHSSPPTPISGGMFAFPWSSQFAPPPANEVHGNTGKSDGHSPDAVEQVKSFMWLSSQKDLDQALAAWLLRLRTVGGDGRTQLDVTFASACSSESDLYNVVSAMGVTIIYGVKKRQTPSGAMPPYAVSGGDATQPCLFVTYKSGSPKLVASIQLVN